MNLFRWLKIFRGNKHKFLTEHGYGFKTRHMNLSVNKDIEHQQTSNKKTKGVKI